MALCVRGDSCIALDGIQVVMVIYRGSGVVYAE